MKRSTPLDESRPWKGLAAGAVAGLMGSAGLNLFQVLTSPSPEKPAKMAPKRLAERIGHELSRAIRENERKGAGLLAHYLFGVSIGALYGAFTEMAPRAGRGAGLPLAVGVWLLDQEVAPPLLQLSKGPNDYTLAEHAYSLGAHFAYGAAVELSRRALRGEPR